MGVRLGGAGELVLAGLGQSVRTSAFRRDAQGEWIGEGGYYAGEKLVPVRNAEGRVIALDVGTFIFTREPYDPSGPIPGGVDSQGWR